MRFSTSFLCFSSLTLLGPIYGQFLQQPGNYWPDYENGAGQQQPWANGFQQNNGQFLPAQAQQQQFYGQWPAQPGQQYYQPPPPSPRAHSSTNAQSSHQLPYASYRGSAFSLPPPPRNLDQSQKERLARIADESESFGTERRRSGNYYGQEQQPTQQFGAVQQQQQGGGNGAGDFQRILASVAEKLPRIAETMARLGGGTNGGGGGPAPAGNEKSKADGLEAANGQGNPGFSLARRSYEIGQESGANQSPSSSGALIDSMPEPASLFSFNKLLSAFGAGQRQGEKMAKGEAGQQFGDGQQPIELKGTPILKSEDLEPELILQQKSTKEGLFFPGQKPQQPQPAQAHLTPPPEIPAPQNPLNSFLQQFGISNFVPNNEAGITTAPKTGEWPKQAEEQQQQGENGDLFGSLMKGKMPQMPDWLKQFGLDSMFGPNGTKPGGEGAAGAEEPGNVLAQLFGKGGGKGGSGGFGLGSVFGSGLDDVPRSRRR